MKENEVNAKPNESDNKSKESRNEKKDLEENILKHAEDGDLEGLKKLLNDQPSLVNSRDSDKYTPLHRASYNNHIDVVKFLLDKGADISAETTDGWQPVHSASKWSHVEVVRLLVSSGADVNALTKGHNTPLHLAALSKNSRQLLEYLLFHPDIDINIKNDAGDTPFDIAKRTGPLYRLWDYL